MAELVVSHDMVQMRRSPERLGRLSDGHGAQSVGVGIHGASDGLEADAEPRRPIVGDLQHEHDLRCEAGDVAVGIVLVGIEDEVRGAEVPFETLDRPVVRLARVRWRDRRLGDRPFRLGEVGRECGDIGFDRLEFFAENVEPPPSLTARTSDARSRILGFSFFAGDLIRVSSPVPSMRAISQATDLSNTSARSGVRNHV